MKLDIETTKEKIFKQYLVIVNPILGKAKLSNTEIEILSRLLLIDYLYRHLNENERNLLIFHTKTRNQILLDISKTNPNFSKAVFNNTIATLKKKEIILSNKRELKLNFENPLIKLQKENPKSKTLVIQVNLHGQDLV